VIKPFQQIIKDAFSFLGDFEFIQNDMFDSVDVVQQPVAETPTQAPASTTSTTPTATPTEKVSDVTYNGAQISSALEIVASVGLGTLTKEQAIVFLVQFLGLDVQVAQSMFETSGNAVAQLSAQKKKSCCEVELKKEKGVEPTPEIEEYWLNKLELVGEVIDADEWELISETDAGIAALVLDLLLIKEKITPIKTIKTTMPITRLRVPLSGLLLAAITLPISIPRKLLYLSKPNLPFGKR
jgi:hypothetical protein